MHHVTEWANGGPTSTDNGVLVCWYHHRNLDANDWHIRMIDGLPEVLAPPWIDPQQRWRQARPPLRATHMRNRQEPQRQRERQQRT
ncbi:HNH endonuclease signature motif containing protein [Leucobacter exalbidus]|uniref:HNH endonuclease signature motif containing protein n=1 Tax=Leucobacter exalbidus TaxID=662960 RepID=UPI001AE4047F